MRPVVHESKPWRTVRLTYIVLMCQNFVLTNFKKEVKGGSSRMHNACRMPDRTKNYEKSKTESTQIVLGT